MLAALAMLLVTASMPLRAQWYVGGRITFADTYKNNIIKICPESGYSFNPHWAVGLGVDYIRINAKVHLDGETLVREKGTRFQLNPYVRFSFFNSDRLSLFVDATASLDVLDTYCWSAGICPGISYALTDHFLAVAKAGFFGYNNDNDPYKWEANLDMTQLKLSLFYLFGKKGQ